MPADCGAGKAMARRNIAIRGLSGLAEASVH
jgi:hypothetical protein